MQIAKSCALAALLVAVCAVPSRAAARVFVSVNGNDANTCSNIATPCRTLNGGVTQVDAGGEVIVIDSGSFSGANITKSVKVNVAAGAVAFSASPITINAGVFDTVVVRGLTIKALTPGTGTGVQFNSGIALYIENCVIDGWNEGVVLATPVAAAQVFVNDTTVRNSTLNGLSADTIGSMFVSIDHSRFESSLDNCAVTVANNIRGTVHDTIAAGNNEGFCVFGPSSLNVHDSVATNNAGRGMVVGLEGTLRAASSIATENGTGFQNLGVATFESLGNNLVRGNTTNTSGTITVVAGQ
jgi:hypothetical protein